MAENAALAARLRDLSVVYPPGVRALERLNLDISGAQITALLGPNGGGKSTLLKVLTTRLKPSAGDLDLWPELAASPARKRAAIGYASQEPALDPDMSASETLSLFAALQGMPRRLRAGRIAELIAAFGLEEHHKRTVASYSGGLRRRLHLAVAILQQPQLLLLDEPGSYLDPQARAMVWLLVAKQRQSGGAVVIATHDLNQVERHCQRVVILDRGAVLADDSPRGLIHSHGRPRSVIRLAAPADRPAEVRAALLALTGVQEVRLREDLVVVDTLPGAGLSDPLLATLGDSGLQVREIKLFQADLASAYFELTGHASPAPAGFAGGAQ